MALQALALYSSLVFSGSGATEVIVTSPGSLLVFHVHQANKLLYQEKELDQAVGHYDIQATGTACAVVQVSGEDSTLRFLTTLAMANHQKP